MAYDFLPIQASVIICTYRRNKVLVETVDQVLAQADGLVEVVIVDQKAQHDRATDEYLRTKSDQSLIRYFNLEKASLTHARNFGTSQARGALLLFCDDDVVLRPNWIREHIAMYEDQDVSAVAGQVLNVGGARAMNLAPSATINRYETLMICTGLTFRSGRAFMRAWADPTKI